MDYFFIKNLHIASVALSGCLFLLRGIWMLCDSAMLQRRWVKIIPHIVDTLLLTSAIIMMIMSGQYPFAQDWLTAKLLALFAYIGIGTVALRGRSKVVRVWAFITALAVFIYIGSVAITKQVLIFA